MRFGLLADKPICSFNLHLFKFFYQLNQVKNMKNFFFILLIILGACSKSTTVEPSEASPVEVNEGGANNNAANMGMDFSEQKLLLEGKFVNGAHPTSGTAKIYEAKDGKRTLVFENLKSDAGPDLRIYIANDKAVTNFIELSNKVENGNKSYEIPAKADLTKQKVVLIWCKQFSVLFGHAELK